MSCIDSIAVYPKTKTIEVGKWYDGAHAEVCPVDAPCRSVVWSSDNTSVATVNPTLGEIWGESLGTARIYATATDGSGISGYMTVTVVTTVPVESVRLNHSKLSIAKGHSSSLIAIVCPENATNPSLNWSSNNEGVATVVNGTISAISEGTAIITATAKDGSGKSASCTVTVTNGILVSSITVNPSEKIMTVDDSAFLSATVYPSNATKKSVCWRSDNPNAVTVNENSGLIVAQNPGTARIYATACDGGGAQGYCEVTVEEPIKVECVCVYPQKTTIAPNEKQYISAYVDPVIATKPYVTWKSSNTNIVTVEKISSGLSYISNAEIIGKNKGTATITATATDGSNKKSSCTVTVDPRGKVIVEKDGTGQYGRIVLSNNRIWNCINFDIINNYELDMNDSFSQRFYDNAYQLRTVDKNTGHVYYNKPVKEYTDEEIKLIYTIDPYGLAAYVREYAKCLPSSSDGLQEMLNKILNYKDQIFKLLFNRTPTYYARTWDGVWYETTDKSDLKEVVSESEFIFGFHSVYDITTFRAFISVALDIISMAIQCPAISKFTKVTKIIENVIKYYSMGRSVAESVLHSDFNGFATAIANGLVDDDKLEEDLIIPAEYRTQNYTLGWAIELLSFSSDLGSLADTFNIGPHFYKEVFTQCANDEDFNILIKTADNKLISISDINDAID